VYTQQQHLEAQAQAEQKVKVDAAILAAQQEASAAAIVATEQMAVAKLKTAAELETLRQQKVSSQAESEATLDEQKAASQAEREMEAMGELAQNTPQPESPFTLGSQELCDSVLLFPDFAGVCGVNQLLGWIAETMPSFANKKDEIQLNLLYRLDQASEKVRGSNGRWFHECCDKKGPTVTVIRSECGHVFGGATDLSWIAGGFFGSYRKSKAFLFGLKTHANGREPVRFLPRPGKEGKSVLHCTHKGPTFGGGYDLYVSLGYDSLKQGDSWNNMSTYDAGGGSRHPFTGSRLFKVAVVEVFQIA
jgi:hypothetical protein